MLVIVSARVNDMVQRGLTLDQVKAARPTLDYDGRYATATRSDVHDGVRRVALQRRRGRAPRRAVRRCAMMRSVIRTVVQLLVGSVCASVMWTVADRVSVA